VGLEKRKRDDGPAQGQGKVGGRKNRRYLGRALPHPNSHKNSGLNASFLTNDFRCNKYGRNKTQEKGLRPTKRIEGKKLRHSQVNLKTKTLASRQEGMGGGGPLVPGRVRRDAVINKETKKKFSFHKVSGSGTMGQGEEEKREAISRV